MRFFSTLIAAASLPLFAAASQEAFLRKEIAKLKELDGLHATPAIVNGMKTLKDVITSEMQPAVKQAAKQDADMLLLLQGNNKSCEITFGKHQQSEATAKKTLDKSSDAHDSATKNSKDQEKKYTASSKVLSEAIQATHEACSELAENYKAPKYYGVSETGMLECDLVTKEPDECLATVQEYVDAALFELKEDENQYKSEKKNCDTQGSALKEAETAHNDNHERLEETVDVCSAATLKFNSLSELYGNDVSSNCGEYKECRRREDERYKTERESVEKRVKDRHAERQLIGELLCMLDTFIDAGKVDMGLVDREACAEVEKVDEGENYVIPPCNRAPHMRPKYEKDAH